MVEIFLICAIAVSIVGGVSAPIAKILFSTYSEERKRLESGGQPRFPQTYIQPEIEESSPPKYSQQREIQEVNNRN
ncbi:hypothetical protein NIES4075_44370 [Tolypothrix sp. NIES-4075]|uniref:DUF1328 domain-containing protein n=1 Tax=Tolypothrix sp. NIES-4075 TaxID=2005459 RepID=UPI000B5C4A90|nr:DUF1328 domain-containing protein [Tolypothrix sp. NIES-4075]GAX43424.1 hypothetical protein NIES4075_44370 [Tolypothrix sp. NIES-4075]